MPRSVDNAAVQELFPEPVVGWVRVAVDRPIDVAGTGLSYALPPELEDLAVGEAPADFHVRGADRLRLCEQPLRRPRAGYDPTTRRPPPRGDDLA